MCWQKKVNLKCDCWWHAALSPGGSRVYSVLYVNFSAEPKEYLVGPGNKGDKLTMTCSLFRQANESDLTIEIFQICEKQPS